MEKTRVFGEPLALHERPQWFTQLMHLSLDRVSSQPENPFAALIPDQEIAIVPSFTLESGVTLRNVPVAYTVRGKLSEGRDNVMVICHALSGSADVGDWWGPLLGGPGKAFDTTKFFVICINSLGSPYGTASPVTNKDGDPDQGRYGPEFPLTTIRDDVALQKLLLDDLGIRQVAVVIGGSLGGMLVLEWAYLGKDYVRSIIPIATSSRHSAWGISWGEAQRQSIYSDPKYEDGYYSLDDPPAAGLGAARMSALLTYRSRDSFESRFGRNTPDPSRQQNINGSQRPFTFISNEHWALHNHGNKRANPSRTTSMDGSNGVKVETVASEPSSINNPTKTNHESRTPPLPNPSASTSTMTLLNEGKRVTTYFSAQSYLRYQGEKFVKRFDSNCYIAITRKLDTHDVSRQRIDPSSPTPVASALAMIQQPALVIGIESDGLFTFAEQQELAAGIPQARLRTIDSPEGHDAFLLQFEQVNRHILDFLRDVLPDLMATSPPPPPPPPDHQEAVSSASPPVEDEQVAPTVGKLTKDSLFGEAEVEDITAW